MLFNFFKLSLLSFFVSIIFIISGCSDKLATVNKKDYGKYIANELTQLYYQDLTTCQGPAYYCGGIMLSGFENGRVEDIPYWTKPYPETKKLSMSFWTERTTGKTLYAPVYTGNGYIFWPAQLIQEISPNSGLFKPDFACAFATDASTIPNEGSGCQIGGKPTCQDMEIYTATDYFNKYGENPDSYNKCGFTLGKTNKEDHISFESTLQMQDRYAEFNGGTNYDEVLVKGWKTYDPAKVPLMAFFYIPKKIGTTMVGKTGDLLSTRQTQENFYKISKIFVPVIRVIGPDWENIRFVYIATDQSPEIPDPVNVNADTRYVHK
ncbi:hypothetical protein [Enterobacteriaceae bacterium NFIX31]